MDELTMESPHMSIMMLPGAKYHRSDWLSTIEDYHDASN